MIPEVALIEQPSIDFDKLLAIADQTLGYSPARALDSTHRQFSETERFLSLLDAISNEHAKAGLPPRLFGHASFSLMIVANGDDLLKILECAAGTSIVLAETVVSGIYLSVVTGKLSEWRDAVVSGSRQSGSRSSGNVKACYCKIMAIFESLGLADVWKEFVKTPTNDRLFLLEDKR